MRLGLRRRRAAYHYRRTIGHGRFNCLRYVLTYDPWFEDKLRARLDGVENA